jgi:putative FmdB family regulatory protein
MPIFDYLCDRCGSVEEKLVKSGEEKFRCPKCPDGEMAATIGLTKGLVIGGTKKFHRKK